MASNRLAQPIRVGLNLRLMAAMGILTALTVGAVGVGTVWVAQLGARVEDVGRAGENTLAAAVTMGERSQAISLLAASINSAETTATVPDAGTVSARIGEIRNALALFAGTGGEQQTAVKSLGLAVDDLQRALLALRDAVAERTTLAAQGQDALAEVKRDHALFLDEIARQVEFANQTLLDRAQGINREAQASLRGLIENEVGTLRTALDVRALGNQVVSLILEGTNAESEEAVELVRGRYRVQAERLRQIVAELPNAAALSERTTTLLDVGNGDNGLFTIRVNELKATLASERTFRGARLALIGKLRADRDALLAGLSEHEAAGTADAGLLLRLRAAAMTSYALTIEGATSEEIARIEDLAKANEALFREVRRLTDGLPADPAFDPLKKLYVDILTMGRGRNSLLVLRRDEVQQGERARSTWSRLRVNRQAELLRTAEAFRGATEPVVDGARQSLLTATQRVQTDSAGRIDALLRDEVSALRAVLDIRAAGNLYIGLLSQAAAAPSPAALAAIRADLAAPLAQLRTQVGTGPLGLLLDRLASKGGDTGPMGLRERELAAAIAAGQHLEAVAQGVNRLGLQGVVALAMEGMRASITQARSEAAEARALLIAVAIAALLLSLGVVLNVRLQVVRRLIALSNAMWAISRGELNTPVPTSGRDELTDMASALTVFRDTARAVEQTRQMADAEREKAAAERLATLNALANRFDADVRQTVVSLTQAVGRLGTTSQALDGAVAEAGRSSSFAAEAARSVTGDVDTVAAATTQLSGSINEIARQMANAATLSRRSVAEGERTQNMVDALRDTTQQVRGILDIINTIAHQTNLLALNATIEAARAGEAGKGFAVVAGEVKILAEQTGKATDDIARLIGAIQGATGQVTQAISAINGAVRDVDAMAGAVAAAVQQQEAATREIDRSVRSAAARAGEALSHLETARTATGGAGTQVAVLQQLASQLHQQADGLGQTADGFVNAVRTG